MAKRRKSRPIPKARRVSRSPLNRVNVTRGEYNRIIDILNKRNVILNSLREELERVQHACEIQFKRTAQIQVELDEVNRVWARLTKD